MYLVIELQKTAPDRVGNLVTAHTDLNEAQSKFHTVLAAAAISAVPQHSAMLIDDRGGLIARETFEHDVADPEPQEQGVS